MIKNNVLIRKAKISDAPLILEHLKIILDETNYHTSDSSEFNTSIENKKEEIEHINSSDNSLILLGFFEDKLIALLTLIGGKKSRVKHVGQLGVNVKKEFWGYGIGSELMKDMDSWIEKTKVIKKVNLLVHEQNHRALGLYKKLNYQVEGRSANFFSDKDAYYDVIYMGKMYNSSIDSSFR